MFRYESLRSDFLFLWSCSFILFYFFFNDDIKEFYIFFIMLTEKQVTRFFGHTAQRYTDSKL